MPVTWDPIEVVGAVRSGAARLGRRLRLTGRGWALVGLSALATVCSAVVMVAVGEDVVVGDGLELRDASNLALVVDHRSPVLVGAARALTEVGSVKVLLVLAVLAAIALWWRGAPAVLAAAPAVALLATGAVVAVVKALDGRARPPVGLRLVAEGDASFPSGHAGDSAAFFLVLAVAVAVVVLRRPLARALVVGGAFALEAAIGLSRLELGVHWPTDVIVGWALGTTVALVVATVATLACRGDGPVPDATTGPALRRWVVAATRPAGRPRRWPTRELLHGDSARTLATPAP